MRSIPHPVCLPARIGIQLCLACSPLALQLAAKVITLSTRSCGRPGCRPGADAQPGHVRGSFVALHACTNRPVFAVFGMPEPFSPGWRGMQMCCAVLTKVVEELPAAPGGLNFVNITLMLAQDPTAPSAEAVQAPLYSAPAWLACLHCR